MIVNVNPRHVIELYEILCEIPFEPATSYDTEPPTERHPAIELIIKELEEYMEFNS